jgi:hypothetical protein
MGTVPQKNVEKLGFYVTHKAVWTGQEAAIGLLPADTTQLGTLNDLAQAAYQDHLDKLSAAKAATATWNTTMENLGAFGAQLIGKIRVKAKAVGGDSVYNLAQIPAPSTPTPVGTPGTATNFKASLLQSGALKLGWKCSSPAGATQVQYTVLRRINGTGSGGAWQFVGVVGRKSITDTTLAAGAASVTYQITASRATAIGEPAEFNVNFGVSGSGEMFATVGPAPKLAA